MASFKIVKESGISAHVARQMREGIALGELAYNFKVKGDLRTARKIMIKASKSPKYTYLATIHALVNCLG